MLPLQLASRKLTPSRSYSQRISCRHLKPLSSMYCTRAQSIMMLDEWPGWLWRRCLTGSDSLVMEMSPFSMPFAGSVLGSFNERLDSHVQQTQHLIAMWINNRHKFKLHACWNYKQLLWSYIFSLYFCCSISSKSNPCSDNVDRTYSAYSRWKKLF